MLGLIKHKLKLGPRPKETAPSLPAPAAASSSSSSSSVSPNPQSPQSNVLLLSGSQDGLIRGWNALGRCVITLVGHEKSVYCVSHLPDARIITGGLDTTARIFNLRTGKCEAVLKGHMDAVLAVKGLSSGHLVTCSADKTLRVWTKTIDNNNNSNNNNADENNYVWRCECTLFGHTGGVTCFIEICEGIWASGSTDKTVRIWSAKVENINGVNSLVPRCEAILVGHANAVSALAWLEGKSSRTQQHKETLTTNISHHCQISNT